MESAFDDSVKIQGEEQCESQKMYQQVTICWDTATSLPSAKLNRRGGE